VSKFVVLAARSTLCVAALVLLTATTPFPELLRVLRRVRLPSVMLTTLALMWRYLSVLGDEARPTAHCARESHLHPSIARVSLARVRRRDRAPVRADHHPRPNASTPR
jgi:hypothetical protein